MDNRSEQSKKEMDNNEECTEKPSRIRQESKSIISESTDGAVVTINNILHGITNSVNRLSDLKFHITADAPLPQNQSFPNTMRPKAQKKVTKQDAGCGPTETMYSRSDKETSQESCTVSEPTQKESINAFKKRNSPTNVKSKVKKRPWKQTPNKCKIKTSSCSLVSKKKTKPSSPMKLSNVETEKRQKTAKDSREGRAAEYAEEQPALRTAKKHKQKTKQTGSSRTSMVSGVRKAEYPKKVHQTSAGEGLIELYHNAELKESDSEGSVGRGDSKSVAPSKKTTYSPRAPGASPVAQDRGDVLKKHHQDVDAGRSLSPIEEVADYSDAKDASIARHSFLSKNYELPTIASKMKQVCKSCLQNFNFQSIPFIASTSTSPSHNLGINIQQVMSIFKTKHPVNGVSPTLVHNLGVAAHRLGGRPYSALLSSLGSRLG